VALTQGEIERKLDQHGEDILSLHELVDRLRTETMARFDAHDARFDAHDARFDGIDASLAEVLRRLPG
jgi:hypothetical protein